MLIEMKMATCSKLGLEGKWKNGMKTSFYNAYYDCLAICKKFFQYIESTA